MTLTLESLQARVALCLNDLPGLIWSAGLLAEAARHALAAYVVVSGAPVSLQGLDGAESTSLPEQDADLLVQGAAAYAAHLRVAARGELYSLSPQTLPALAAWARAALNAYAAGLEAVRRRGLNQASQPPYGPWQVKV